MVPDKRQRKSAGQSRGRSTAGKRIQDPGSPYPVLWHPGADAERDASWPAAEKVAMLHAAQKLEAVSQACSRVLPCPRGSI
jgi:hypothetical protein